jgi:hypothetical protein
MPSFVCESCNDIVKKPAVKKHRFQCDAAAFSCIDCNRTFVGANVDAHTSCISEAEKYQGALFTPKKRGNSNNNNSNESAAVALAATSSGGGGNQSNSIADSNNAHGNHDSNGRDHVINSSAPLDSSSSLALASKRAKKESDSSHHHHHHHDNNNNNKNDIDLPDDADQPSSDFAAILDQMQDFKWKKSISAILKSNHGQMPLDSLSSELVASFHAAFATRLTAVVEAKVRSSKKLKLVTGTDGRTIVTTNKE